MTRRYTLSIGINKYLYANSLDLEFARPDAESIEKVLSDVDRGGSKCELLVDGQATKKEILGAFNRLLLDSNLGKDDFALIYYSGHGGLDSTGNLYLVANDTKLQTTDPPGKVDISSCVHIRELEVSLDNSKVGTIVLIIDACYSGASGKAFARINLDNKNNVILIGASRSKEVANEIGILRHGLFTSCFLEGLNQKPVCGEWITLQQLLSFAKNKMLEYASQELEISAHSINPDILVAKNPISKVESLEFTKIIQEVFNLLRVQIITIPYPPNFFIAKLSLGLANVKTGVLCLDNSKTEITDAHIDQFLTLVEQLRSRKQLDRGLLVTEKTIDPCLEDKIQSSITNGWRTRDGLIRDLMDFELYLHRLVNQFENVDSDNPAKPAIAKYYVDLRVTDSISGSPQSLIDLVEEWLFTDSQKLAVLGEYGFGKTVFCKKLGHDLARDYLSSRKGRIPILINLGKFPRIAADLQALIIDHLVRNCDIINPSWAAFERMNDGGLLLLIFDGLDEMAVRTSREIVEQNLFEIEKLAKSPLSKIIVTSRPEYFWTSLEEKELLTLKGIAVKKRTYDMFTLNPFSVDQIKNFLQQRIPLVAGAKYPWTYYFELIKKIYDLPDLSKRPVFLEMISETLPKMIEAGTTINRNTLYETYLTNELKRQEIEKRRVLKLSAKDRFRLMQILALDLFRNKKDGLTSREILELLRDYLNNVQMQELEGHISDFLSCSFLRRRVDTFVFSHQTILEFFVSIALVDEITKKTPDVFGKSALTEAIIDFLSEKTIDTSLLWDLIAGTKKLTDKVKDDSFIASNAVSLLNRYRVSLLGKDLSNLNLKEARLEKANLSRANLDKTNLNFAILNSAVLTKATLRNSKLEKAKLMNSNMTGVLLGFANLRRAVLTSAILKSADLTETNLEEASLEKANLSNASLKKTILISSKLSGADFQNADMQAADLRCAKLENANLSGANLSQANLGGAILSKANLSKANLEGAKLANADLSNADIRGTNLNTALFEAKLKGVIFDERTKVSLHNIDPWQSLKRGYIDQKFAKDIVDKRERF